MSKVLKKVIIDCKTGKQAIVSLSADEIAQRENDAASVEAERVEREAIEAQKATDAQAGRDALVALGLTEAQITALVGA
jgi:Holliday junction resolvasome RuvABC DNA-binding subunit